MLIARLTSAIDFTSGNFFGQTYSQFCALEQPVPPPGPTKASRRSSLFISPVGWVLNSRTWATIAAPMKVEHSLNFGQAFMQQPQLMQRDSS